MSFFHRLSQGLGKMTVTTRFFLSRLNWKVGPLPKVKLPWWKLGLAALAFLVVLKKDIQLSVNLRSPLGGGPRDEEDVHTGPEMEEMNIAQSIVLREKSASSAISPKELDEDEVRAYIDRFAGVAVSEMKKFGIPASIKMAQAILESRAGTFPSTREQNNHFGHPLAGQSFDTDWENWRDHSLLLYHEYEKLFELGTGYKKWAQGLRKAGYSSDPKYDRKLVELIEKYKLYLLDEELR